MTPKSQYDPWTGHSMADRDYREPQTTPKEFAPEPKSRFAPPDPPPPKFVPRERRSTDMQVDLYQEANTKGLQDVLESVMSNPRPGPGDNYRGPDGKLRFRIQTQGQGWLIVADTWNEVLQQLDAIEGGRK